MGVFTRSNAGAKDLDLDKITSYGERVVHLRPNVDYFGHLSIYHFALQFCHGAMVLDAGSGTGYGSAFLADNGAKRVCGIDVSRQGVDFSKAHFPRENLTFQIMDLQRITGFPAHCFDVLFSSNVLEHIPNVPQFLRGSWRFLKPDAVAVIAVPPIVNEQCRAVDLQNPYHLNSWSPRQWNHVLLQYFQEIQPYRMGTPELFETGKLARPITAPTDYVFEPIAVEQFPKIHTITALFVARRPRAEKDLPDPRKPLTFVDNSFSRRPSLLRVWTRQLQCKMQEMRARRQARVTRVAG
jgi:2-polyprenyl-3-methyl-5-hydroxy-6-metoxy-1,4-benzoquinol methylase